MINGPLALPRYPKCDGRSYAAVTCGSALGSESFTRQKTTAGVLDLVLPTLQSELQDEGDAIGRLPSSCLRPQSL